MSWGDSWGDAWGDSWGDAGGGPGPSIIVVPNVVLAVQAAAISTIEAANLTVALASAYSNTVPVGSVISQSPNAGSFASAGDLVTLTVSLGPVAAASSAYSNFTPEIAFIMDEAFERAGISPQNIGQEQIASFLRSVQLQLFSEWATLQINNWLVKTYLQPLTAAEANYAMPAGAVDVLNMVYIRQGVRTPIERSSRRDMLYLATPTSPGRPDRYFVDRLYNSNTIGLWLVPDRTGDQILYEYISAAADVGSPSTSLELPPIMLEAFVSGIAMRLAQKWNKDRYGDLRVDYGGPRYPEVIGGKLQLARQGDRERADVRFSIHRYPRKR